MAHTMAGKVALITGGSSGIGRSTGVLFAREGTIIDINLKGVWLCMKAEILQMQKNGGGAIANISSIGGLIGFPRMGPYVATKHGIIGLTKTAALEYAADHIRVNVICPGLIDTPMADRFVEEMHAAGIAAEQLVLSLAPLKRRGTPEEIAEAAVWLCSDAASYVTGHSLVVDGGFMAI